MLAAVTVLPVGAAYAEPVPPASGPEAELVPGVPPGPYQPWQIDTPDQVLAPKVYTPTAAEDAVEPRDAMEGTYALVEYVPLGDAAAKVACSKRTGPYQRQVERWLKLKVDGKQSGADCLAIRAFQTKHKIKPNIGFAGPVTWAQMQLLSAKKNPNAAKKCPVRSYRVACVDLTRQLTWVQKGKKVRLRAGADEERAGRVPDPDRVEEGLLEAQEPLVDALQHPHAVRQFFDGGQAFHAVYGSIHTTVGSWGCVNLRLADARKLWGVLKKGDRVYVWGRRAGT